MYWIAFFVASWSFAGIRVPSIARSEPKRFVDQGHHQRIQALRWKKGTSISFLVALWMLIKKALNYKVSHVTRPTLGLEISPLSVEGIYLDNEREATNTTTYVQNQVSYQALDKKTLKEVFTGVKPDIGHLMIFGCPVYLHVSKDKRNKLEATRKKLVHLLVMWKL